MSLRKEIFILLILPSNSEGGRRKLAFFALFCLVFPLLVSAQISINNPLEYNTFGELTEAIINFIFNVALVLAPLFLIIGGFYFITASGDPKNIETGKRIILYTSIGLLIILLAKGLVALIREVIGA